MDCSITGMKCSDLGTALVSFAIQPISWAGVQILFGGLIVMEDTGTITWLLVNHRSVLLNFEQEALDEPAARPKSCQFLAVFS